MKLPDAWVEPNTLQELEAVIRRVFGGTSRLCEILLYGKLFGLTQTKIVHAPIIKEVINEKSPYAVALEGGIINDRLKDPPNTRWVEFSILSPDVLRQILTAQGI